MNIKKNKFQNRKNICNQKTLKKSNFGSTSIVGLVGDILG